MAIIERIKWRSARKEMEALHRYRAACELVYRWNGQIAGSAETADWIIQVGEGKRGYDISEFRERLIATDSRNENR